MTWPELNKHSVYGNPTNITEYDYYEPTKTLKYEHEYSRDRRIAFHTTKSASYACS